MESIDDKSPFELEIEKKTELIHIVIANGATGSLIEMEIE